jgi:hypothetical protein
VVYVAYRAYVHVRFRPLKLCLCHVILLSDGKITIFMTGESRSL